MGWKMRNDDLNAKNLVFDQYVRLDEKDNVEFKAELNSYFEKGYISRDDALNIVYHLMFCVLNYKYDQKKVKKELKHLVDKIKEYNDNDESFMIKGAIFFRDYSHEKYLLRVFVKDSKIEKENGTKIGPQRNIEKPIKHSNHSLNENTYISSNVSKNIDLDRKIRKYATEIRREHPSDWRKILKSSSLYREKHGLQKSENESNQNISKPIQKNARKANSRQVIKPNSSNVKIQRDIGPGKQINKKSNEIKEKIKAFNDKSLSEMISSKREYQRIHEKINNSNDSSYNNDINVGKFNFYFTNFDKLELLADLENKLNEDSDYINNFYSRINDDGFLSSEKRENIILQYGDFYNDVFECRKLPLLLKKKSSLDFVELKRFAKIFNDLTHYTNLAQTPDYNEIKKINLQALDGEINRNEEFFNDITDKNKKRAIVIDERNVKVNAGAGTGKTFTIQNKVNYLIKKRGISPERILCLCYTIKGASDLNDKVNEGRDEDAKVEACTFHEFCRRIARDCGINKGRTNRKLLMNIVYNYSKELMDDEKLSKLIDFFSYYINSPADKEDISTYNELLDYENERDLKTLKRKFYESGVSLTMQGETVDSIGELIIANYLFRHDIDYVYGGGHESKLIEMVQNRFLYSGNSFSLIGPEVQEAWLDKFVHEYFWSSYVPDFYLPEKDLYLEHFGIGHSDNEKWLGKDYEPQIQRKIEYHDLHQTNLIKTYYCYLEDGILEKKLEEILRENKVTISQKDPKEILEVLRKTNKIEDFDNFNKLIMSFINIFEAQNNRKNKFDLFKKMNESETDGYKRNRQRLFLDIVSDIYDIYYESNEGERIDNNREISLALELILTGKYSKSYDYILIDEYQDINPIRSLLLQELQKITNAKLFVVGDDWQSIYRFNGSDLNLFIDFDNYFPNSEFIRLQENRRNFDKLNKVASKFIQENSDQEEKILKSIKKSKIFSNPIRIINYSVNPKRNKVLKLYSLITRIIQNNPKKVKTKILLLGRNNSDINEFANNNTIFRYFDYNNKVICLREPKLDITFMTIHASKGLQYDEVVILNFKDKLNGFPNKIEDDSILRFLKEKEKYPYAEERRLLYVALTRTCNNVYLLAPTYGQSVFIDELIEKHNVKRLNVPIDKELDKDFYKPIKSDEPFDYRKTDIPCPNCEDGKITVVRNNETGKQYIRCSNHPVPNPSHYSGGPYWGNLEDYIFIEKCPDPNCDGVLVKDYDNDRLICSLNMERGCKKTKKINLNDYNYD